MKFVLLPFLILFFFGCNKIELGYKFAPKFIANRLDDSFDFNSNRFNKIRLQLEADFKDHKKDAATAVNQSLDQLTTLSEKKDPSADDFKKYFSSVQENLRYLISLLKPTFQEVIKNLSKEEFDHLNKFSLDKFKEADKLILNKEEFFEKQMSSFEKITDFLFDSTTTDQRNMYKKFLEEHYDFFVYQIEVRKTFLKNFEAKFNNKDELLDYTLKYYSGDPSIRTAEHQKKQLAFLESVYQLEYQIWLSTTDKQKESFKKTLSSIKEELKNLMN